MFPFRGEPEIPNKELFELVTGEGTKGLLVTNLTDPSNKLATMYTTSSAATAADTDAESF
jgi:hypothetical protein